MNIDEIRKPVAAEYEQFAALYHKYTHCGVAVLEEVAEYLDRRPGKRLRPLLLLLSAKAVGTVTQRHILLAVAMELLHNATLMHDDVIDETDSRRGGHSIRGHWGNQVAVLSGDYYLSQVMGILHEVGDTEATTLVSKTVAEMCHGELLQLSTVSGAASRRKATATDYLRVIGMKTASLMGCCCELGGGKVLRDLGYSYGMLFQIRDDEDCFDAAHDIALPSGVDRTALKTSYREKGEEVLNLLPYSEAREALRDLIIGT